MGGLIENIVELAKANDDYEHEQEHAPQSGHVLYFFERELGRVVADFDYRICNVRLKKSDTLKFRNRFRV